MFAGHIQKMLQGWENGSVAIHPDNKYIFGMKCSKRRDILIPEYQEPGIVEPLLRANMCTRI